MLECKACIRSCLRTLFAGLFDSPQPLPRSPHHRLSPLQPRRYAAWIPRRAYTTEAIPFENLPPPEPSLPKLATPYVGPSSRPSSTKQIETYKRKSLEQEVQWLKDPLKLGDHTVKLLRGDQFQKALEVVRLASRDISCTVSWNHLVDYEMSKGRVTNATKIYNEMKKRAQRPDAHTFTTLFRGFAWHANFPLSAPRALSIYHSMFNANSPVKPNIIHTNAVLKVCALAGDLDGLLGVAAKLPTRGMGAPNNYTFTTILNAIRSASWNDTKGTAHTPAKNERANQTVIQGKRLWEEIRERWSKGDLLIDEELVCAMGRVLLLSYNKHDWDDILSLVEQTMGIRRQVPRLDDPAPDQALNEPELGDPLDESIEADVELQTLIPPQEQSTEDNAPNLGSSPFSPLPYGLPKGAKSAVRPGQNTLSMVIDACTRLRLVRAAQNYWGILTNPDGQYNITPDSENYHMYLRLLRVQRASRLVVELLQEMKRGALGSKVQLQTKTFRIALSACMRDKNNPTVLAHAANCVEMMTDSLPYPDARALSMYLELAMSRQPRDWRVLMSVIHGTEPGVRNLRSLLAYDRKGKEKQSEDDILALVRGLVGASDAVLDIGNEEMEVAEKKRCREQRYSLAAWITKTMNRRAKEEAFEREQKELRRERGRDKVNMDVNEDDEAEDADDRRVESRAYTPPKSTYRGAEDGGRKVSQPFAKPLVARSVCLLSSSEAGDDVEGWGKRFRMKPRKLGRRERGERALTSEGRRDGNYESDW